MDLEMDTGESLGLCAIQGLKSKFRQTVITDAFQGGKKLPGGMLLAVSLSLAAWMRREIPDQRLAIVLPPGLGTTIANIACVLANKVPVNLNFTAGRASIESAIAAAGIRTALTADAMVEKLPEFPWPSNRLNLVQVLRSLGRSSVLWRWAVCAGLSASQIATFFGVRREGGDREAALLFTSGSSDAPKGVVLTHRNLVSNVRQVLATLPLTSTEKMLGCLPTFHSFGFTVTIWYPIFGGPEVVTYVSPLEAGKLTEIIAAHGISLAVMTPTFLRGFLRKATPPQLQTLKMVVTGAEKLPADLREEFERHFAVPVREGYGLTETSPVISVNLLEKHKPGSVGPLLPEIEVRVTDPQTKTLLPSSQTGMLWFRGPNIFPGYLDKPELNTEIFDEGWFCTGDLGRIDEDGFLFIEGRLSRFSKIGGEMVPHGGIELALQESLGGGCQADLSFAVTGRSSEGKGEELVLLMTRDLTQAQITHALHQAGLPNLWIPKILLRVDTIPTLPSGKLDLRRIQDIGRTAPLTHLHSKTTP